MVLFGASGHAKVIIDIIQLCNKSVECIFDDYPKENFLLNIPVKHSRDIKDTEVEAIVSIGDNRIRKIISEKYHFRYVSMFHPSASISNHSKIDAGTVVLANCSLNASSTIGKHCIINTGAVVEHDCTLEDYVHISPNASLAGNVTVGEGTHIGIGASVIQGVRIGKWSVIGAGSVIIRDIPDHCTVVGNPGKIIKNHQNEKF